MLDVELWQDAPRRRDVKAVRVGRRADEDCERPHPVGGISREKQRPRGEGHVLSVEKFLVAYCKVHVPLVGVERSLAPAAPAAAPTPLPSRAQSCARLPPSASPDPAGAAGSGASGEVRGPGGADVDRGRRKTACSRNPAVIPSR